MLLQHSLQQGVLHWGPADLWALCHRLLELLLLL
jgi:hypothetical protein